MRKSKPDYIIIDFTAKHRFTHQSPLILKYSEIITQHHGSLLTLLPKHTDRAIFENLCGDKKFILANSIYGPEPKDNIATYLVNRFISTLFNIKNEDSFLKKFIRWIQLIKVILYLALFVYKRSKPQVLLFPTADPLSIELLKLLSKSRVKNHFKFRIRLVGNESRGQYGHEKIYAELEYIAQDSECDILIGYETKKYRDFLIQHGISRSVLAWSPWPVFLNPISSEKQKQFEQVRIGFIGGAKKRKGFDLIPRIIELTNESNLKVKFVIQKAVYPWPEYIKTIHEIRSSYFSECELLDSFITTDKLMEIIASINCLVLPYDSNSYKINASGILYHGADLMVPSITFAGVGFEDEITEFGLGVIIDSIQDIPTAITTALSCTSDNFINYNRQRTLANESFLSNSKT